MLTVISLGAGVQSTTMALMAARGEITPMPDAAIFADTQAEPKAVYEHLKWLMEPGCLPFPVHIVTKGNLWKAASTPRRTLDGTRSYIKTSIPVYTRDGLKVGMGKRQCTGDYKIDPVQRKIRQLVGLKRVTKRHGIIAEVWIGISADEEMRRKPSRVEFLKNRWPLLERDFDRDDCLEWLAKHGYPQPPRSACTFCPFRDDDAWLSLTPDEFADVVAKEKEIQAGYAAASTLHAVPFFTEGAVPIETVKFTPTPPGRKPRQLRMFNNECEGMCGV